jgi:hypothetical protein
LRRHPSLTVPVLPGRIVPTFRPKRRPYSQRRDSRYIAQIIAKTPAIESTATTQKSIATTHSPLSLAVGSNEVPVPV